MMTNILSLVGMIVDKGQADKLFQMLRDFHESMNADIVDGLTTKERMEFMDEAMARINKIRVIKMVRDRSKLGLAEAIEVVKAYFTARGWKWMV